MTPEEFRAAAHELVDWIADRRIAVEERPVRPDVEPGDIVFFDSYAPHKSDTNTTSRPRRALYLTYNAASHGDLRATYYEDKQAEFEREGDTFGDERVRISVNDDFLGKPVAAPG